MNLMLHTADGLRPRARRLARWVLAAVLLATLAPGISRGLAAFVGGPMEAGAGERWVELCTSQGMHWVRVDLQRNILPADPPAPEALDHCGHCTLAAERFAPLVPDLPALPVIPGQWPTPSFTAVPGVAALTRAALPRGPPLLG